MRSHFCLEKGAPILGPGKRVAAHVRESKIPAQGLHSTCAGALAVQKGQLEVCPFQVDRNYVLNFVESQANATAREPMRFPPPKERCQMGQGLYVWAKCPG